MKTIAVLFFAMGLLVPFHQSSATSFSNVSSMKKIIDIYQDENDLWFESDHEKGEITMVRVYQGSEIVLQQTYGPDEYLVSLDISGLARGNYTGVMYTTTTNYSEGFTL